MVSLSCPTPCNHTPPQLLDVPNHMASQTNQTYYQAVCRSWYLMGQTDYPSKSWIFKSRFSFKVRQHGQQQLYLPWKYDELFTKWQVLLHFHNPSYAFNHSYKLHQKSIPLLQSTFTSLFHSYFLTNPPLQSPAIFRLPIFAHNHPSNLHQKYFPNLSHLANSGWVKGPRSYGVLWGMTLF